MYQYLYLNNLILNKITFRGFFYGWLRFTSHRQGGHLETAPYLVSLVKDVELSKYTVPTGNRTPGCRVAVHYATAAPCKLH